MLVHQIRFEYKRVRMLLKAFDLADRIPELIAAHDEMCGERRLTFKIFHEFFPTFPFTLVAETFYKTSSLNTWGTLSRWMTRFNQTFVYKHYANAAHLYYNCPGFAPENSSGLPFGMIFPWDRIKGGLIIHNGKPQTFESKFMFQYLEHDGHPTRLFIERFDTWVNNIVRSGWEPDGPCPATQPVFKSLMAQGTTVPPWLAWVCGPRDALLLAWLLKASGRKANRWQRTFRSRRNGILCLAFSCKLLVREIGLEEQQIRRALDALSSRKFITLFDPQPGEKRMTYLHVNRSKIWKVCKGTG